MGQIVTMAFSLARISFAMSGAQLRHFTLKFMDPSVEATCWTDAARRTIDVPAK